MARPRLPGLRVEGAVETAIMGGKNKQRTKGNLRVSARWPSRRGAPAPQRDAGGWTCAARLCRGVFAC